MKRRLPPGGRTKTITTTTAARRRRSRDVSWLGLLLAVAAFGLAFVLPSSQLTHPPACSLFVSAGSEAPEPDRHRSRGAAKDVGGGLGDLAGGPSSMS